MLIPPRICPGDTLGIIAPSGPLDPARNQPALEYLRARGYTLREGDSLSARDRYLAGSDEARAADIITMFADPKITGIFAARGGYGSGRLLDLIDYDTVREHPKALVGFSDTTALQLALWSAAHLVSWSGALLSDVKSGVPPALHAVTEKSLWDALEQHHHAPIDGLAFLNGPAAVSGPFVGGCLSLVSSLAGTPWLPDPTGALVYLEDVGEPPYRVDRMLNQLRQAGVFHKAAAVLLGRFEGCEDEPELKGTVDDVFRDLASALDCPVVTGLPYGHGKGRRVLPIGLPATLAPNESGARLTFDITQQTRQTGV